MTDIQNIIDVLLPELIAQIDSKNGSDLLQKLLDNGNNNKQNPLFL